MIKNVFFGVTLGILIQLKYIQKELRKKIKSLLMILIMKKLNFLRGQKILTKLKQKTTFAFNAFCYENKLIFPIYISEQRFENAMEFLLLFDGDRSHYVYIKDFDKFVFHKTKNKNKKYFFKSCLQCFISKNVLNNHKEVSLNINGAQSLRLEKGTIEFKKSL